MSVDQYWDLRDAGRLAAVGATYLLWIRQEWAVAAVAALGLSPRLSTVLAFLASHTGALDEARAARVALYAVKDKSGAYLTLRELPQGVSPVVAYSHLVKGESDADTSLHLGPRDLVGMLDLDTSRGPADWRPDRVTCVDWHVSGYCYLVAFNSDYRVKASLTVGIAPTVLDFLRVLLAAEYAGGLSRESCYLRADPKGFCHVQTHAESRVEPLAYIDESVYGYGVGFTRKEPPQSALAFRDRELPSGTFVCAGKAEDYVSMSIEACQDCPSTEALPGIPQRANMRRTSDGFIRMYARAGSSAVAVHQRGGCVRRVPEGVTTNLSVCGSRSLSWLAVDARWGEVLVPRGVPFELHGNLHEYDLPVSLGFSGRLGLLFPDHVVPRLTVIGHTDEGWEEWCRYSGACDLYTDLCAAYAGAQTIILAGDYSGCGNCSYVGSWPVDEELGIVRYSSDDPVKVCSVLSAICPGVEVCQSGTSHTLAIAATTVAFADAILAMTCLHPVGMPSGHCDLRGFGFPWPPDRAFVKRLVDEVSQYTEGHEMVPVFGRKFSRYDGVGLIKSHAALLQRGVSSEAVVWERFERQTHDPRTDKRLLERYVASSSPAGCSCAIPLPGLDEIDRAYAFISEIRAITNPPPGGDCLGEPDFSRGRGRTGRVREIDRRFERRMDDGLGTDSESDEDYGDMPELEAAYTVDDSALWYAMGYDLD